jgi:site-specific DNA-methyltransferase (cytosine-N4-specific)
VNPVIEEHDVTVYQGDVREVLAQLPAESVQCVCTSPPYYALRDYGTAEWEGGTDDCDHKAPAATRNMSKSTLHLGRGERQPSETKADQFVYRAICGKCGARRVDRQIGLEASPAEYVETMRAVFAEVRRVLAADGVLWLNLGDSYSAAASGPRTNWGRLEGKAQAINSPAGFGNKRGFLPEKNLMGIPWRVAFALQDDGWILRNAVIWHKPNAMPESVRDRLSTRYEHVFLFSKSRRYWFDVDPIREAYQQSSDERRRYVVRAHQPDSYTDVTRGVLRDERAAGRDGNPLGRNPGDVWTIATSPFPGAHFATMPPALVKRCIRAGCPDDGTVLDPFTGSGTTAMVARQLGRRFVGAELNPSYIDIIRDRIGQTPLDFGGVA